MDTQGRIPHDDWADQDLLTKAEAAERLADELTEVKARLSGADADADADADETLRRRLNALEEAYKHLTDSRRD